jgi:hypothetical protein
MKVVRLFQGRFRGLVVVAIKQQISQVVVFVSLKQDAQICATL